MVERPQLPKTLFIGGIGGAGMSLLAFMAQARGWTVAGYDDDPNSEIAQKIRDAGIPLFTTLEEVQQWMYSLPFPENIQVAISGAFPRDHPLVQWFQVRNIPCYTRMEVLREFLKGKQVIAVTGTHGKSSTTAFAGWILNRSPWNAEVLTGASFRDHSRGGYLPAGQASSRWVVLEADEYRSAFLNLPDPEYAILVSLDHEHVDCFPTEADMLETYRKFLKKIRKKCIVPASVIQRFPELFQGLSCELIPVDTGTFLNSSAEIKIKIKSLHRLHPVFLERVPLGIPLRFLKGKWESRYGIFGSGNPFQVDFFPPIPGTGYYENAGLVLTLLDILLQEESDHIRNRETLVRTFQNLIRKWEEFPGLERRMEFLYADYFRALVVDYAHHPVEVESVLRSLRLLYPDDPLCVVFQPHLYSRTRAFGERFARVLEQYARYVLVTDVYGAREEPDPSVTAEACILHHISRVWKKKVYLEHLEPVLRRIYPRVVVLLGAGDISRYGKRIQSFLVRLWKPGIWKQRLEEPSFRKKLSSISGEIREWESLARWTTLRIGGPVRYLVIPETVEALVKLLNLLEEEGVGWRMLGRGSNVLIGDDPWWIVAISGKKALQYVRREDTYHVRVGAGTSWMHAVSQMIRWGLKGLEAVSGVPGTAGGALLMNAGAYGTEVFDRLVSIRIWDPVERSVLTISAREIPHGYRYALFGRQVILDALFHLEPTSNPEELRQIRQRYLAHRKQTQPIQQPNAGCFFRNLPDGTPTGKLLDELGFKGMRVGSVYVSPRHANFFVHDGDGTARELLELIERVRNEVYRKTGKLLQMEVLKMGNFDAKREEAEVV